jgi:hypothetical protein
MSVSPPRRISYLGNPAPLPSEAEGAKGSTELVTLRAASASARLIASSEESPRELMLPESRWCGRVRGKVQVQNSDAVAIQAA